MTLVLANDNLLLWVAFATAGMLALVRYQHHRWQEHVERERFVLGLKAASTPDRLKPRERSRLELLRAPWWAVWRWLPDRLGARRRRAA